MKDIDLLVNCNIRVVKLVKIHEGFAVVKNPAELHRLQQWAVAVNFTEKPEKGAV